MSVYIVFGTLYTIIMYPVVAHWVWGGGWLAELGMQDFAGSTVVHLTGATAALVATILLETSYRQIQQKMANLTSFRVTTKSILYSGSLSSGSVGFGFNPGSTLSAMGEGFFGYVALTTNVAAAAGGVAALLISWAVLGKSDIPSMLNGVLAALVAITGACAFVEPWAALVIGAIAGIITFFTAQYFDRKGIDDPIYAFSVHGIAGMWGAISTGLFATPELAEKVGVGQAGLFYGGGFHQLGVQLLGLVGAFAFVLVMSSSSSWAV